MSRGPGRWQKTILTLVNEMEQHEYLPIHELFLPEDTRSTKESARRAARTLAKKGLIQAGEGRVTMTINGKPVERTGLILKRADGPPIPVRGMSYREIASAMGVSHNTVAKIAREQEAAEA